MADATPQGPVRAMQARSSWQGGRMALDTPRPAEPDPRTHADETTLRASYLPEATDGRVHVWHVTVTSPDDKLAADTARHVARALGYQHNPAFQVSPEEAAANARAETLLDMMTNQGGTWDRKRVQAAYRAMGVDVPSDRAAHILKTVGDANQSLMSYVPGSRYTYIVKRGGKA